MIIYGDPQFQTSSRFLFSCMRASALDAASDLDRLRTLLVRAGQLEQALADADDPAEENYARQITDRSADAFYAAYSSQNHELPAFAFTQQSVLADLQQLLQRKPRDQIIVVKLPEGFEFYSLYPEQYCHAALAWHVNHCTTSKLSVLVIGLRSVGTSLSAIVAATLRAAGWQSLRLTVRPVGHPFRRIVKFPALPSGAFSQVVIVDEGPGLSGSSLRATFDALAESGFRNISVLPGHSGGPGAAATPETRTWWRSVPQYCIPLEKVSWNGQSLLESLMTQSRASVGNSKLFEEPSDVSGGRWRQFVFANEMEWPPVAKAFERQKILCRSQNSAVLWKFNGFDSISCPISGKSEYLSAVAHRPIGRFRGFTAFRWIKGSALARSDSKDPTVVYLIAQHILSAARANVWDYDQETAVERLVQMLQVNVSEALGEKFLSQMQRLAEFAKSELDLPGYGDGHLAPHEWIRDANGLIRKTDSEGHAFDHTVVGPQSLLWDVAGALIEWDLDKTAGRLLLDALHERFPEVDLRALEFYRAAYAAFRMGLFYSMAETDPKEQRRLNNAVTYYKSKLLEVLQPKSSSGAKAVCLERDRLSVHKGNLT